MLGWGDEDFLVSFMKLVKQVCQFGSLKSIEN